MNTVKAVCVLRGDGETSGTITFNQTVICGIFYIKMTIAIKF